MTDTSFYYSSSMANKHERIRNIKHHINQLLAELRLMEPNNKILEDFHSFNTAINSSLTIKTHEKCFLNNHCPYLACRQAILHSTTYEEYKKVHQRKTNIKVSPKKQIFTTSTPKNSPKENNLLYQPYLTSTPRRNKRQSTNIIPLKRLLYHHQDFNRQGHSIKRTILPRYCSLNPTDDHNPQWI